jgi:hypothetical protein
VNGLLTCCNGRLFTCCNGRLAHSSVRTLRDNVDKLERVPNVWVILSAGNLKQGVFR